MKRTKFILKTDWSLDYTGLGKAVQVAAVALLVASSYVFDRVSLETYCGVEKAKKLPMIRSKNILRIPVGYPQNVNSANKVNKEKNEKRILCVARISPMKGQDILIRAFAKISKNYPDWSLRLVGPFDDINYKQYLDDIIFCHNLTEKVSFYGYVSEDELYDEFSNASIFCLPSVFLENAGNVKYEAISFGIPVVTTDVPCRRDSEEMGCLVAKAGDIDDLAKNLQLLMANPSLRRDIAEKSREKILSYRDVALLYRDL